MRIKSQTQCSKRGNPMSEIKTRITPGPWSTDYVKDERGMYSQKVFDKDGDVLAVIDWCGYEVSPRSEERRVGKEWRTRWGTEPDRKNVVGRDISKERD